MSAPLHDMTPGDITDLVSRAYEAGVRAGYRQAVADGPLIQEALAAVEPWAIARARLQEIEHDQDAAMPQSALQSIDPERWASPLEREHARLLRQERGPGTLREADGIHPHLRAPRYLGRHPGLRALMASALAHAQGDHHGSLLALLDADPRAIAEAGALVTAEIIEHLMMCFADDPDERLCAGCAAEIVARSAESG